MDIYNYILCMKETYPRPTPATYPRGAGTPKKCFLLRVFNETEAMLTYRNACLSLRQTRENSRMRRF